MNTFLSDFIPLPKLLFFGLCVRISSPNTDVFMCVGGGGVATAVPFSSVIKDAVGKETSISGPQKECINVCVKCVCRICV